MAALLELSEIHFAYPGRPPTLAGASLGLAAGERLALTGANGAGKSTLLQIMVGLLAPTAGEVIAFGRPRHREADFHEVRRRVGLVFQDPDDQLFCPTVAEDVAFGPLNLGLDRAAAEQRVAQTLARLDLTALRERITHKLSGGEKRLVSLAAVLAMEPEVLLLDEPSNGLDEATTERLIAILESLPQTLVLVSHDPALRDRLATRTLRLEMGRLIPDGPDQGRSISSTL